MEKLKSLLTHHPFLTGLEPRYTRRLLRCASPIQFKADQYLFREGDEARYLYLIRRGKVALEMFSPGWGQITIQTLEEGDVLGWSWLVPPYRKHFDARAVEATEAVALDGKRLRTLCEEDPGLGYELLKRLTHIMAQRLQATRLQLLDVYATRS